MLVSGHQTTTGAFLPTRKRHCSAVVRTNADAMLNHVTPTLEPIERTWEGAFVGYMHRGCRGAALGTNTLPRSPTPAPLKTAKMRMSGPHLVPKWTQVPENGFWHMVGDTFSFLLHLCILKILHGESKYVCKT